MSTLFKKLKNFLYTLLIRISIALHRTDEELKADRFDTDPSKKRDYRKRSNNPLLLKMEQGQRDERYVQDYYEVLKKADHFMKHASEEQIAIAADKHGMDYGKKDRWGRRFEHYGFFDPRHKNYGKTLAEALAAEAEERKTKDDDYPVIFMIDNHKKLEGFAKINDLEDNNGRVQMKHGFLRVKDKKFRISVGRKSDVDNKIEQLTDFLHVKRVSSEHRILEFFIDKKYGLIKHVEGSEIFNQIINVSEIWFSDEWGTNYGFSVSGYRKRIDFDSQYEVIKFNAKEIVKL